MKTNTQSQDENIQILQVQEEETIWNNLEKEVSQGFDEEVIDALLLEVDEY